MLSSPIKLGPDALRALPGMTNRASLVSRVHMILFLDGPPSMAAVMATVSSSMRRMEGNTSACIGLVCAHAAYTSFSSAQCPAPARYSVPDTRLAPSAKRTSRSPCAPVAKPLPLGFLWAFSQCSVFFLCPEVGALPL